jgi:cytochrome oxidase assembly protein ShyY1
MTKASLKKKFQVHRFDIDRFKLVTDPKNISATYLVPENYSPSWPHPIADYEVWFARDLEDVARSAGENPLVLATQFTSKDPKIRAGAYLAVGLYHGFDNLDDDPLDLHEPDLNKRWE